MTKYLLYYGWHIYKIDNRRREIYHSPMTCGCWTSSNMPRQIKDINNLYAVNDVGLNLEVFVEKLGYKTYVGIDATRAARGGKFNGRKFIEDLKRRPPLELI